MACPPFIAALAPSLASARPHITLTWAQSLDAKLAGPGGTRVLISGPETMRMTHWLRATHDAIMVGINTIIMDDPRLQLVPELQEPGVYTTPQPLILDPALRIPLSSRILTAWTSASAEDRAVGRVKQPWVICSDSADPSRARAVEEAGGRVVLVALDPQGRIPPAIMPDLLVTLGLGSLMVEGGARVLSSFLRAGPRPDGSPVVDSVIVTVAPMLINGGVSAFPDDAGLLPKFVTQHTETMGKDAVMLCTLA